MKLNYFKISIVFNLIAVFIIGFIAVRKIRYHYQVSQVDPHEFKSNWNEVRNAAFKSFRVNNDIVFIGTSITEGFPVTELFHRVDVVNRGISMNTTTNMLNRINSIAVDKPKAIFIEGGMNDIRGNVPMDTTLLNMNKIVAIIEKDSPETKIYIQSVTPAFKNQSYFNGQIIALNKRLQQISGATYIDLYTPLANGDYSVDGIHLNGEAYEV